MHLLLIVRDQNQFDFLELLPSFVFFASLENGYLMSYCTFLLSYQAKKFLQTSNSINWTLEK